MNSVGNAIQLHCRSEQFAQGTWRIFAAVAAQLQGELTISGVTNLDGSPATWSLPAGTGPGVYAAPGSGLSGGGTVFYSLAEAADAGKVIAIALPK